MFDEIVIIDRWASHRHNPTTGQWNKMNADVFREVKAPKDWWAPVRESMMLSLGIENIVSLASLLSSVGVSRRLGRREERAVAQGIRS
jgi:hypothetical protein